MSGETDGRKPNLLMIVADCLTNDLLTIPRYRREIQFPRLFSESSVVCSRMITSSTTTTPAFGSMLSGLFPAQHGIRLLYGNRLRKGIRTLPMILRERGYRNIGYVSGPLFTASGLNAGFDEFEYRGREVRVVDDYMKGLRNRTVSLMSGGEGDVPTFVLLHIWDLHDPRYKYVRNGVLNHAMNERFKHLTYYNDYLDALRYVDRYLKELIGGVPEDTVVMVTGDHGEMYQTNVFESFALYPLKLALNNKKLRTSHGHDVNLQLLEVPFFLRYPGGPSKAPTIDRVVRNVDMFPTLLEVLGVDDVPETQAESVLPLVGRAEESNRIAYSESGSGGTGRKEFEAYSVMDNHFQVRYYPHRRRRHEFYSLRKDRRLRPEGELFELYKGLLDDYLLSSVRADVRELRERSTDI